MKTQEIEKLLEGYFKGNYAADFLNPYTFVDGFRVLYLIWKLGLFRFKDIRKCFCGNYRIKLDDFSDESMMSLFSACHPDCKFLIIKMTLNHYAIVEKNNRYQQFRCHVYHKVIIEKIFKHILENRVLMALYS